MDDRVQLAENFLQEAVYRSREKQTSALPLAPRTGESGVGNCGLGAKAAVALDLSARGEVLFDALWKAGIPTDTLHAVHGTMTVWIERQDALDRKRNHFLKDFRNAHGFDRTQYDPEQNQAYRSGLDAVNAEIDAARRAAALELLQKSGTPA